MLVQHVLVSASLRFPCREEGATTIMLRSLPSSTTTSSLMRMLGQRFVGSYDFLYLPRCTRQRHRIVEMAFINFVDPSFAKFAVQLFRQAAAMIQSWSRTRVSQARIQGRFVANTYQNLAHHDQEQPTCSLVKQGSYTLFYNLPVTSPEIQIILFILDHINMYIYIYTLIYVIMI